jgi:hypothetical protein
MPFPHRVPPEPSTGKIKNKASAKEELFTDSATPVPNQGKEASFRTGQHQLRTRTYEKW